MHLPAPVHACAADAVFEALAGSLVERSGVSGGSQLCDEALSVSISIPEKPQNA
jgi:hypothetical protein